MKSLVSPASDIFILIPIMMKLIVIPLNAIFSSLTSVCFHAYICNWIVVMILSALLQQNLTWWFSNLKNIWSLFPLIYYWYSSILSLWKFTPAGDFACYYHKTIALQKTIQMCIFSSGARSCIEVATSETSDISAFFCGRQWPESSCLICAAGLVDKYPTPQEVVATLPTRKV